MKIGMSPPNGNVGADCVRPNHPLIHYSIMVMQLTIIVGGHYREL